MQIGRYIVRDNASINTGAEVKELIESLGHKCVYLPPYFPFLNPIEELWSNLQAGIRDCFDLSARIAESAKHVKVEYCQGWIRHATIFFDKCLAMEPDFIDKINSIFYSLQKKKGGAAG